MNTSPIGTLGQLNQYKYKTLISGFELSFEEELTHDMLTESLPVRSEVELVKHYVMPH